MEGTANSSELSINVVTNNKLNDAKGLEPIRHRGGHRVLGLLCHGHDPPPANRESLTLLVTQIEHGKPFVLPQG